MQIIFSSKNVELTDGLKTFIERKTQKLKNLSSSLGLSHLFVNLDVNRSHKGVDEDAIVELVGDVNHKKVVIRKQGKSFYVAFFAALTSMRQILVREKEKSLTR